MEYHLEQITLAAQKLHVADHLLHQTYPLIKDPKLLVSIVDSLHAAIHAAINSIVAYEQLWKRITPVHDNPGEKLFVFSQKISKKYGFPKEYAELAIDLTEIIKEHKQATVEFSRRSQFVISDDRYQLRTLSVEKLNAYLQRANKVVVDIEKVVKK